MSMFKYPRPVYYIKGTLPGGYCVSTKSPMIQYHLGLNVHPSPDKKSTEDCADGIHLAKSLGASRRYTNHQAREFYLAKPGVILGEGSDKVRVVYCFLIKKLTDKQLEILTNYEKKLEDHQRHLDEDHQRHLDEVKKKYSLPLGGASGGLAGSEWVDQYIANLDIEAVEAQGMVIEKDGKKIVSLTSNIKDKDLKTIVKLKVTK